MRMDTSLAVDLRYYQNDAADAAENYLKGNSKGNGVIEKPTGSGKTYTLAEMIRRFSGIRGARTMVVSHTKNIVLQDYQAACKLFPGGKNMFGIHSSGLKRRDTKEQVIFGGVQSMFSRIDDIGEVNVLIPDECHRVNIVDSVHYKKLVSRLYKKNDKMRVIGLTASPFRMGTGLIYGPSSDLLFDHLIYQANTKELMAQGYLAKPVTPDFKTENMIDTNGVRSGGVNNDFIDSDLSKRANVPSLIKAQVAEVLGNTNGNESIAVFAVNTDHADNIAAEFKRQGEHSVEVVHSKIKGDDAKITKAFKNGSIRVLVSVNMFIEGFDAPNITVLMDCKPTNSPGRYLQMYGRGFRLCAAIGKTTFTVFDYAGNVGRHGPVDQVKASEKGETDPDKAPKKQCEKCGRTCHSRLKTCPYCGWIFPPPLIRDPEDKTSETAGNISIISEPRWFDVKRLHCAKSTDKGVIIAHYYCKGGKFIRKVSFDEDGIKWLIMHLGEDIPFDAQNFFAGSYRAKIKTPKSIFVDEAGTCSKILEYCFE